MSEENFWKNNWVNKPLDSTSLFAKRVIKVIKNHGSKTLLDLGCGAGRDSLFFFKNGLNVTAVDWSESGVKGLKKRNNKITCIQSDIKDIDFKPNSYDVIYAHLSLHYFDDKTTKYIFEKLYKILKKDGLIFIKCKSTDDPKFGKGEKIEENMYFDKHMRHFFTKEYMSKKLEKFKVISIKKTSSVHHNEKSAFIEAVATK